MTFTDVDLSDHHTVSVTGVVPSGTTSGLADNATVLKWLSLGTLTDTTGSGLGGSDVWNFSAQDKSFDYLADGETLTLTYTVQVDDGHGGVATQPVTITVTGTNDTPFITSGEQIGAITERFNESQPNPTGSATPDTATGAVTFTDVDLSDAHTVSITGVVASGTTSGLADNATVLKWLSLGTLTDTTGSGIGGSDAWTFSAQDKNFDYLAAGETLTLTYTVQVDDGHGGVVSQPVTITVTGTNDTPVITSGTQTGTITERSNASQPNPTGSTTADTATGTVTFTDVDLSDHHTVTVTGVVASGITSGPGEPWQRPRLADVRHADRHHGQRHRRFRRLDLLGAGQELRLSRRGRDPDADLHGAGRRRPWRRCHPAGDDHGHRHQRYACHYQRHADRHDHGAVQPQPAESDRPRPLPTPQRER